MVYIKGVCVIPHSFWGIFHSKLVNFCGMILLKDDFFAFSAYGRTRFGREFFLWKGVRFNVEARPSAKQLELDSDGETGDVGYSERPVPECGYHIKSLTEEFVEKRDVAKKRFAFQIIGKPLPDIEKRAQSGGKPIIFRIRIPVGFPHPIVFARYEIEMTPHVSGSMAKRSQQLMLHGM